MYSATLAKMAVLNLVIISVFAINGQDASAAKQLRTLLPTTTSVRVC